MIAQAKILRVLKLIGLLKSRNKSVHELAEILETTTRSVYRYLELLEELGFIVDRDFNGRYFIHSDSETEEMTFTENEAVLLKDVIQTSAKDHPLKESLLQKLYVNSDLKTVANNLLNARTGSFVSLLGEAIKHREQVLLKKYQSARSGEVSDRVIEPIYFTENYNSLVGLDTKDKLSKHFKLDRIGRVDLLNKPNRYSHLHQRTETDCFGMGGEREIRVSLVLNLRAYLLMKEEHPRSLPFLKKAGKSYKFEGPILSFEGVGRFILGLVEFIKVESPPGLVHYLNKKIAAKQF